jgi:TrmH family RNA methyltransferase
MREQARSAIDRPIPDQLRIVLVGTSHPGNIGAAARAMQTMGVDALHLVAPECDPWAPEAQARSAGAERVMSKMIVHDTLEAAIGDCHLVYGSTARRRSVALEEFSPRDAAPRLISAARSRPVALLFGRERTGLENDELQRCHAAIHIPTDPDFGSLNLAAAVQVLAYELRLAALDSSAPTAPTNDVGTAQNQPADPSLEHPATLADMERFFEHLQQALVDIDFHKGRHSTTVMHRLRRLFLRSAMDTREVRILRGILAESQRMARLAGEKS